MEAVWADGFYIGTAYSNGAWTYAQLCQGIESVTPNINEQNQQYFFVCGHGGAHNEVTGIAPQYDVSGRRIVGNAAQDYIDGLKYKLGDERKSSFKVVVNGETIVADCTIANIVSFGGSTLDVNQFSCSIMVNGIPTVTTNPT
jgi:hypothetical protein